MIELFCSGCKTLKKSVCFPPHAVRKWMASGKVSIRCIACARVKRKAKIAQRREFRFGRALIG
jgi:hypothetical protein